MMDYQLTLPAIMRRAESLWPETEIVSRLPDRSLHRYRYRHMFERARRLANALRRLGVGPGDRVGTLGWNHHQHLEAYFAIPSIGAVLHTLNLRLHASDLAAIVSHARDRIVMVDRVLLPLFEQIRSRIDIEHVIVMGGEGPLPDGAIDYEALLDGADASESGSIELDERQAAAMCYTSGTTGRSKGVLYSHRALVLQCLYCTAADILGACQRDVMLAVVPMFHINGWGMPFTAPLVGAKLVLPGSSLDADGLLDLVYRERVTLSAGVPTVWLGVLQALDGGHPADVSSLRTLLVGGSAVPRALMEGYDRYGVRVVQGWGMTEVTAIGSMSVLPRDLDDAPADRQYDARTRAGVPVPFVEIRARSESGLVPWDGETMGELEVRGATVASAYYDNADGADCFTSDGWFRTGDIVTIDPTGSIRVCDRSKDLIKSGGEWISSVALESALMGHPAVAEAAVVAVRDPKWDERPLACVVVKAGHTVTSEELRAFLAADFAKWWLPDAYEFVDHIPRTSTGKFLKSALRERFQGSRLVERSS
jgi:fatty-acyl-CoA synthase